MSSRRRGDAVSCRGWVVDSMLAPDVGQTNEIGKGKQRTAKARATRLASCPDCHRPGWTCGHGEVGTVACLTGAVEFKEPSNV